jgi:hypothetical protein
MNEHLNTVLICIHNETSTDAEGIQRPQVHYNTAQHNTVQYVILFTYGDKRTY